MTNAEQAAWAIVWATAVCGLLAAIGSFLAAWAAQSAAKTAIDISQQDRRDRLAAKQADDTAANWRAALSLQAPMKRLVELVELAIACLEAAETTEPDERGKQVAIFGSSSFDYMADALAYGDLARIGNLAHLANDVSGDFGTVVLQALSWSREAAALLEHVVDSSTFNLSGTPYTTYFIDFWFVPDALAACRALQRHAAKALKEIDSTISVQRAGEEATPIS